MKATQQHVRVTSGPYFGYVKSPKGGFCGPTHRIFDSVVVTWGWRICPSNFSGEADAAGLWTRLSALLETQCCRDRGTPKCQRINKSNAFLAPVAVPLGLVGPPPSMHPCGPPESPWKEKEGQRVLWDVLKGEASKWLSCPLLALYWPKLSHMAPNNCKGGWEMQCL